MRPLAISLAAATLLGLASPSAAQNKNDAVVVVGQFVKTEIDMIRALLAKNPVPLEEVSRETNKILDWDWWWRSLQNAGLRERDHERLRGLFKRHVVLVYLHRLKAIGLDRYSFKLDRVAGPNPAGMWEASVLVRPELGSADRPLLLWVHDRGTLMIADVFFKGVSAAGELSEGYLRQINRCGYDGFVNFLERTIVAAEKRLRDRSEWDGVAAMCSRS